MLPKLGLSYELGKVRLANVLQGGLEEIPLVFFEPAPQTDIETQLDIYQLSGMI
jgi:hypothetical protein